MAGPDFREWADTASWGEDWWPHLRRLSDEMASRGATFGRVTKVETEDAVWVCVDGWRERPDDQGAEPIASDICVGFV